MGGASSRRLGYGPPDVPEVTSSFPDSWEILLFILPFPFRRKVSQKTLSEKFHQRLWEYLCFANSVGQMASNQVLRSHTRYQEPFNCGTVTSANLHCFFLNTAVQLASFSPSGSKYRMVYSMKSTTLQWPCITDKRLRGKYRTCRPVNLSSPEFWEDAVFMTRLELVVSCLRDNFSSL